MNFGEFFWREIAFPLLYVLLCGLVGTLCGVIPALALALCILAMIVILFYREDEVMDVIDRD